MSRSRGLIVGMCLAALAAPAGAQRGQYDDRDDRSERYSRDARDPAYDRADRNPGYDRDGRNDRGRGQASATFFTNDGFAGRSVVIDRATPSLRALGIDNRASSIGIDSGRWLVCADENFRGRCEVVDRSTRRLSNIGLDRAISSARPLGRNENVGAGWNGQGNGGPGNGGGGGRPGDTYSLPGGSWAQSCRRPEMIGGTLRAQCNDGQGRWRDSQIEPRQCQTGRVGNRFGQLTCE